MKSNVIIILLKKLSEKGETLFSIRQVFPWHSIVHPAALN